MAETTTISWCHHTWSPWYGCTQVSLGAQGACVGCFARQISEIRMGRVVFGGPGRGEGTRDVRADSAWKEPLRWDRQAGRHWRTNPFAREETPRPQCFVFPSMCDPFDNHPALREPRRRFFDLIRATPNLTWLLLTKRPGNIVKLYEEAQRLNADGTRWTSALPRERALWPRNAAIGCTVVTQEEADRDVPKLLAAKAALSPAFAFLSMEPLLGPVDLRALRLGGGHRFDSLGGLHWHDDPAGAKVLAPAVDWVITGGETDQGAHRARPSHPDWFRSLRDQCAAAGVPYHHKQNGEFSPLADCDPDGPTRSTDVMVWPNGFVGGGTHAQHGGLGSIQRHVGKKHAGRLLDGVEHNAMPEAT